MTERKRLLAGTTGSAIAALLALAGMGSATVSAAAPATRKAVTKKVVKKPVKKVAKKVAKKKAALPPPPTIVYLPTPPVYIPAPPAPPAPSPYADASLYLYIDDADALLDTVGTSPPDYSFRFDGIDCWAWELSGGELVLAEPVGDGFRFYAFAPRDAYPFFIGDRAYSYGFDGRSLAAVYGGDAQLIAWRPDDTIASGGGWLSERGRAMRASITRRAPVIASDWANSLYFFSDIELRFGDWRSAPGWSRYRTGTGSRRHRDWRARLGDESDQRRDRAERFDRWRRDGYRGMPPQNNGGWNTVPGAGGRPGSGQGGWNGRPRPVAPAVPGAAPPPPRTGRTDDGRTGSGWRGGGTSPPVAGQPTPAPAPGRGNPQRPPRGGTVAPTSEPLPPPVYVAPPAPPSPPRSDDGRSDGRGVRRADRPDDAVPTESPAPPRARIERPAVPQPLPAPVYVPPPAPVAVAAPTPPAPADVAPPPPAPAPADVAPPPAPVEVAPPPPPPPPPPAPPPVEVAPPPPPSPPSSPPPPPPPAKLQAPVEIPSDG